MQNLGCRGMDNRMFYMLAPGGEYYNYSGCGNTVNYNHPLVRRFLLDCLRFWVSEYHVDGFRCVLLVPLPSSTPVWTLLMSCRTMLRAQSRVQACKQPAPDYLLHADSTLGTAPMCRAQCQVLYCSLRCDMWGSGLHMGGMQV